MALLVMAAIGCQTSKVESNGYDSPQEAADVFISAMIKKDWETGFRCFTPESRDLVIAHVITMTRYVALLGDKEQEVDTLFKRLGYDHASAKEAAENMYLKARSVGYTEILARGQII